MDVHGTLTLGGRVTVPKAVREALGLRAGDTVLFCLDGDRAVLTRSPNFLELGGSIPPPAEKRGPWGRLVSAGEGDSAWNRRSRTRRKHLMRPWSMA